MNDNQRNAVLIAGSGLCSIGAMLYAAIQQWRVTWMATHVRAIDAENKSLRQRLARERYCARYCAYRVGEPDTPSGALHKAQQEWDAMDPDQRDAIVRQQEYKTTELL